MTQKLTTEQLRELVRLSAAAFEALPLERQEELRRRQQESFVRSIVDWPKSNYHFETINGERTKVYHSIEDYYND